MKPETAQAIVAHVKDKSVSPRMTTTVAQGVLTTWIKARGWTRDRFGNFLNPDNTSERYHFSKQKLHHQEKDGDWRNRENLPMIDAAVNLIVAAAVVVQDGELEQAFRATKGKRQEERQDRVKESGDKKLLALAHRLAVKEVAFQQPKEIAAAYLGKATQKQIGKLNEHIVSLRGKWQGHLTGHGQVPDDGQFASADRPPFLPVLGKGSGSGLEDYRWTETVDGVRYSVSVKGVAPQEAQIEIGRQAGMSVSAVSHTMTLADRNAEGDAYISGRVFYQKDRRAGGALFLIMAGDKQRGAGTRVLSIWCRMMAGYGIDRWIAQAVGPEGAAFMRALEKKGKLSLLDTQGAHWVVSCSKANPAREGQSGEVLEAAWSRKGKPSFAFHVTLKEFLPQIAQHGLLPTEHRSLDEPGIFVEDQEDEVEVYMDSGRTAMLRFPVDGFSTTDDGEYVLYGVRVDPSTIEVRRKGGVWKKLTEVVVVSSASPKENPAKFSEPATASSIRVVKEEGKGYALRDDKGRLVHSLPRRYEAVEAANALSGPQRPLLQAAIAGDAAAARAVGQAFSTLKKLPNCRHQSGLVTRLLAEADAVWKNQAPQKNPARSRAGARMSKDASQVVAWMAEHSPSFMGGVDGFAKATTDEVAKGLGWKADRAYKGLAELAKLKVVVREGHTGHGGKRHEASGKRVGWMQWEMHWDHMEELPQRVLEDLSEQDHQEWLQRKDSRNPARKTDPEWFDERAAYAKAVEKYAYSLPEGVYARICVVARPSGTEVHEVRRYNNSAEAARDRYKNNAGGVLVHKPKAMPSRNPAEPRTTFTTKDAQDAAAILGIDFAQVPFDVEQFRRGMVVELEHGRRDPKTNVTDDTLMLTGMIAWAHLNELPDYYYRLAAMEKEGVRDKKRPTQKPKVSIRPTKVTDGGMFSTKQKPGYLVLGTDAHGGKIKIAVSDKAKAEAIRDEFKAGKPGYRHRAEEILQGQKIEAYYANPATPERVVIEKGMLIQFVYPAFHLAFEPYREAPVSFWIKFQLFAADTGAPATGDYRGQGTVVDRDGKHYVLLGDPNRKANLDEYIIADEADPDSIKALDEFEAGVKAAIGSHKPGRRMKNKGQDWLEGYDQSMRHRKTIDKAR